MWFSRKPTKEARKVKYAADIYTAFYFLSPGTKALANFELDTMQPDIPSLRDRSISLGLVGIPPFKMRLQCIGQLFVEVFI